MKSWLILLFLLVVGTCSLRAEPPHDITGYTARLSTKDHFNPQGERLKSAADIIRMDRVNFHKFHNPDSEDEGDNFFDSEDHRQALDDILKHSHVSAEVNREIVEGTPLIHVLVNREASGNIWVDVKIIHH